MHVKCGDKAEYILKTPHSQSVCLITPWKAGCSLLEVVQMGYLRMCLKVHVTFYRLRYAKTPLVHLKQYTKIADASCSAPNSHIMQLLCGQPGLSYQ